MVDLVVFRLVYVVFVFFFQAEDGIRDLVRSRGLGDVYKRQEVGAVEVMGRSFAGQKQSRRYLGHGWQDGKCGKRQGGGRARLAVAPVALPCGSGVEFAPPCGQGSRQGLSLIHI